MLDSARTARIEEMLREVQRIRVEWDSSRAAATELDHAPLEVSEQRVPFDPMPWLRAFVVAAAITVSLFVIVAKKYPAGDRNRGYGTVGAILGYLFGVAPL